MMRSLVHAACLATAMLLAVPCGALAEEHPTEEEIGPVHVLESISEAMEQIFSHFDSVSFDTLVVDSSLKVYLEERLNRRIRDSVYLCYNAYRKGEFLGTAVISEEAGKYRPITFVAGISPEFRVLDVRVLVYRESRGGEVQRKRFLRQYRKKTLKNPIAINRDIINITGATISVRSLNAGVRKALAVAEFHLSSGSTGESID